MACPYRVALERAGRVQRLPNPFAALGQVAHTMSELYWKGEFRGLDSEELEASMRATWDSLVAAKQRTLEEAYGTGVPPKATDWPGYALTRSRTIRTLRRLATARSAEPRGVRVEPEIELADAATGLYGQLDRLEGDAERLTIVDLKSSIWQDEMKPDQRRQLLLYAWLVKVARRRWPSELAIETAAGRQTRIQVDPKEVGVCVAEAQAVVRQYNLDVDRGWEALESAARPGKETCRSCPARLQCEPYWAALRSDWLYHGSARGAVTSSAESPNGRTIMLNAESPRDRSGTPTVVYQVRTIDARPGDRFAVVGADERGDIGVLRCRWDTQAAVIKPIGN